jgi:hypothetical protein
LIISLCIDRHQQWLINCCVVVDGRGGISWGNNGLKDCGGGREGGAEGLKLLLFIFLFLLLIIFLLSSMSRIISSIFSHSSLLLLAFIIVYCLC